MGCGASVLPSAGQHRACVNQESDDVKGAYNKIDNNERLTPRKNAPSSRPVPYFTSVLSGNRSASVVEIHPHCQIGFTDTSNGTMSHLSGRFAHSTAVKPTEMPPVAHLRNTQRRTVAGGPPNDSLSGEWPLREVAFMNALPTPLARGPTEFLSTDELPVSDQDVCGPSASWCERHPEGLNLLVTPSVKSAFSSNNDSTRHAGVSDSI